MMGYKITIFIAVMINFVTVLGMLNLNPMSIYDKANLLKSLVIQFYSKCVFITYIEDKVGKYD